MPDRTIMIDGVRVPRFFYGTAWKEDETTRLTGLAIGQGFRGINTANQRKHYHEAGVGFGRRGIDNRVYRIKRMYISSSKTVPMGTGTSANGDKLAYIA